MDDIFAIQMLKARYFRAVDTKDWDLLRSVLAEDVAVDVTDDVEGSGPYTGAEVFVSGCARILAGAVTVHHGHMPEIHVDGDAATGTWAMEDHVELADGTGFRGAGHYHETYIRAPDGQWRIQSLTLKRLRRDPL